ncbi:MAG: hypothetical protein ACRD1K_12895 [Acidimicrobiales bacterium]
MTDNDAPIGPPAYPVSDDAGGEPVPGAGRGTQVAIVAVVLVVVVIVVLHLTGVVGPTAH